MAGPKLSGISGGHCICKNSSFYSLLHRKCLLSLTYQDIINFFFSKQCSCQLFEPIKTLIIESSPILGIIGFSHSSHRWPNFLHFTNVNQPSLYFFERVIELTRSNVACNKAFSLHPRDKESCDWPNPCCKSGI